MENPKLSMQKRVEEMISMRPLVEKLSEEISVPTPDQIEAAKYLEIDAQKRETRVHESEARVRKLQSEIKIQYPKIELDYSERPGVIKQGRRGEVLAAERAWSTEKPNGKPAVRPIIPPPAPAPQKGFWGRLFS